MPLLHILLCSSLDTPPEPSPLFDVRVHASCRRTSPVVLTRPSLSAWSRVRFRHPLPSTRSRRAELEHSAVAGVDPGHSRHPASIRCAQSRFASPRTHSTPPRARSCPTQAEIEPQQPSAIAVHRAPPPSPPSFPLRPFSAQINPSVSFPATSSLFISLLSLF